MRSIHCPRSRRHDRPDRARDRYPHGIGRCPGHAGNPDGRLDTSDAPQAMQDADGNLTGYAVDAARALACRMGLKVAFVDASSADSALSDKKADIFIGDARSTDGDISSLGTCLYDAPAVFGKSSDGESLSVSTETLNTATLAFRPPRPRRRRSPSKASPPTKRPSPTSMSALRRSSRARSIT